MTLPRLPLGISDFAKLREPGANHLYVDKTAAIGQLLDAGTYLFLARPRRFGKSLLCSTIRSLYEGRRDLFAGLAIEPVWNWQKTNPVVHLSLVEVGSASVAELERDLDARLADIANGHGVSLPIGSLPARLIALLAGLHAAAGRRVVFIVDEYEKPVHDHIEDLPTARAMRAALASFYGALKACDAHLEKVFITGIGRMVKTSVFSALNQMLDCTLHVAAATVCGVTETELRRDFAPWIPPLATAYGLDTAQTWERLRQRYNGYWWGEGDKVYNPWAVLTCLHTVKFHSGWWASGTPRMLLALAERLRLPEHDLEGVQTTDLTLLFDLEAPQAVPLLWQTGYLTITGNDLGLLTLGFPNAEVREAWFAMVLDRFMGPEAQSTTLAAQMLRALERDDRATFEKAVTAFFAGIPSELTIPREAFYHTVLSAALQAAGGRLTPESRSWTGRADAVLELTARIVVIEFKLGPAAEGLRQLRDRRYHDAYAADPRPVTLLVVGGFGEKRLEFLWEAVGA